MHRTSHNEPARGQHHTAKHVEADPNTPRELVAHVRDRSQTVRIADIGRVNAKTNNDYKYHSPKSWLEVHRAPSLGCIFLSSASAAATSSRRWVIQYTPPNTRLHSGIKSGIFDITRPVYSGNGVSPSFSDLGYPKVSKGTLESSNTLVPPTSVRP